MPDKIRKQFYIEPEQEEILKKQARVRGVTEAELVREALNLYTISGGEKHRDVNVWDAEKRYIKKLMQEGKSEKERPRGWKREDLYDR